MPLNFPYPVDFLSHHIRETAIPLALRRFDESSGSGDGRVWSARMAPPLWTATLPLVARSSAEARAIDAKILALDGMGKAFLWADRSYSPAAGGTAGQYVSVSSISADRTAVVLSGLPAGYEVSIGDRLSLTHGSGRVSLATFSAPAVADASGNTDAVEVYPYLPLWADVGQAVEMDRPCVKMCVEAYTGFMAMPGQYSHGASLSLLQRVT
ncbi:hypothetical protein [Sinirhodobacter huangdaonensis]|uniref:Uncharacterized protein n=1 Tax=Paenirhodobacter huangdaonensis TaxID=2501515 RepID=A0A443M0H8_9RHOB|nr:hypothetical protein [Sinirhodobacter huangdaonensis]RWR54882.1 hypothetical protein EOW66_02110 [Sinirhodobacter huangdaonensis]